MFDFPKTAYTPGTIFRVDKSGASFTATVLTNVPILVDCGELPVVKDERRFSANGLVKLLNIQPTDLQTGLDVNKTKNVTLQFGGAKLNTLTDENLDRQLETLVKHKLFNWRTNSSYFVVRETVSASSLKLETTAQFLGGLNLSGTYQTVSGNVKISKNTSKSISIDKTFTVPHNIYFKPEQLKPLYSSAGDTGVRRVKVTNLEKRELP
jgi:hypothetical protein